MNSAQTAARPMAQRDRMLGSSVLIAATVAPAVFIALWMLAGQPAYPWDATWYQYIAESGYSFDGDIRTQQNVAFLPGYPLLIHFTSRLLDIAAAPAQRLISVALCVAGSCVFAMVFARRLGMHRAVICIVLWTLSPFSIYFLNGYSEVVLYALSALALDAIDRGRFATASLLTSFILISRPNGVAVIATIAFALLLASAAREQSRRATLAMASRHVIGLMPLMFLLPMALTIYWYARFEDALVYKSVLYAWQGTPIEGGFLATTWESGRSIGELFAGKGTISQEFLGVTLIMLKPQVMAPIWLLASMAATGFLLWRRELVLGAFCVALIAFALSQTDILNIGRHVACCFALPYALSVLLAPGTDAGGPSARSTAGGSRRVVKTVILIAFGAFLGYHFAAYELRLLAHGWVS